jgi:DNA helicase-2/ATP-dependent DNA helicase PcrA
LEASIELRSIGGRLRLEDVYKRLKFEEENAGSPFFTCFISPFNPYLRCHKFDMPGAPDILQYNQSFLEELARLNAAQREAVEHIEGPVLVVAGPGTGKTHILAARIGRILWETDAQPHNILCLTFTDAGVQAMRQRLIELIGPEAHKVPIFTFHSFCNRLIQDNLELFGKRDLEPLDDLERVEIIRRILDELPWQHPLKSSRPDAFFYENHLRNLFRTMKTENWSPDSIEKNIAAYLDDLPNREAFRYKRAQGRFQKGDVKQAQLDAEKEKMDRLLSAAHLFPRYEQLLSDMQRYDYEDMILWVLRAFDKHPALLARYQEQYLYFLVDEYQDTNGAQNEVLHRLIAFWENPNVFIVGDDDQSIYEFQGARLKNITDFYDTYREHLKLVVLKENYRSSQHILDTSGALIQRNDLRIVNNLRELGIEKILTARHGEFANTPVEPAVVEYPDRLQEEVDIVAQIETLFRQGFPLDEVAVIFAKHRQARRLIELLEKKGIPFRTRRSMNILDLPLVQNLRLLLEYLHSEFHKPYSGEHLLFRILHFDFFGIAANDLARLSVGISKQPQAANGEPANRPFWRNVIGDAAFLEKCGLANPAAVLYLSAFLEKMLADYANVSLPAFIERIFNRSGMLRLGIWNLGLRNSGKTANPQSQIPNSQSQIPVLFTFLNFVKKETDRNPRLTLGRLLDVFRSMDANRLGIEMTLGKNEPPTPPAPRGEPAAVHRPPSTVHLSSSTVHQQKVNLLTAHGSKGLEFQKVFLLDCVKDNWEPGGRGNNHQFALPDTLAPGGEADALEARRRLFYVGMTRAKEMLQISYARCDDNGKELERAVFTDELLTDAHLQVQPRQADNEAVQDAQFALLLESKPIAGALETDMKEEIAAVLANLTLSISSLNQYLRCPLSFYYEKILGAPIVQSEAASFGIAMHNALRRGYEKMLSSKPKAFPPPVEFVRFFELEMAKLEGYFSKKEYERRLALGQQYLAAYVTQNAPHWNLNAEVEKELKNVVVEGVPLTGILDRLDFKGSQEVHLLDYKTGSQDAAKLRRPQPAAGSSSSLTEYGGPYWRQLVFYKILYENWRNNPHRVVSAEISYLEPDARGQFPRRAVQFEPGDVAYVKGLIKETYAKIMREEFYEGCGEANCSWCSFLKRQQAVDSFAEGEIEALDD